MKLEINSKAPAVVRKEIHIKAAPGDVWAIHTDINGWSDWNPDVSDSKLEGSLTKGAVFNWTSKGFKLTSIIQDLEPEQRIGWTGRGFGSMAKHLWILEPDGDGGTILRTEESLEGWLVNLLKGKMQRTMEISLEGWLIDLKNEVEMEANGSSDN